MGKFTWPLAWIPDPPWMRKVHLKLDVDLDGAITLWETDRGDEGAPELVYEVYDYSSGVGVCVMETCDLIDVKCWLIAKGYLDG